MSAQNASLNEVEKLRQELRSVRRYDSESLNKKFQRKVMENPLLPIGCLATVCAMGYGLWHMACGKNRVANHMMKLRVVAQGLTVASLVAGVMMTDQGQGKLKGKW